MTQKQMADYLGLSLLSYQRKENGQSGFYFKEIKEICDKAKVSLDEVICEREED